MFLYSRGQRQTQVINTDGKKLVLAVYQYSYLNFFYQYIHEHPKGVKYGSTCIGNIIYDYDALILQLLFSNIYGDFMTYRISG